MRPDRLLRAALAFGAVALASGAVLLVGVRPVSAAGQRWTSSFASNTPNPLVVGAAPVVVSGTFAFDPAADRLISTTQEIDLVIVTLTRLGPARAGCDGLRYEQRVDVVNSWDGGKAASENRIVAFSSSFAPACNGTYEARAFAIAAGRLLGITTSEESPALVHGAVQVVAPPPGAEHFAAAPSGSDASLTWHAPTAFAATAPADFSGYVIERKIGTGFRQIAAVAPGITRYVDAGTLAGGRSQEYRVRVARMGAAADQQILSTADGSPTKTVSAAGSASQVAEAGAGTAGARTVGSRTAVSGGSTGISSGTRTRLTLPARRRVTVPTIGSVPTRSRNDSTVGRGHGGAQSNPEQLAARAQLRDEGAGTSASALLTPVAIALVLVLWAAQLRHLNRRAKPLVVSVESRSLEKD